MAKRPALIKLKKKLPKKTNAEQYAINFKAYGDEPIFTSSQLQPSDMTGYYNWYNYMCDAKEGKEYLLTYLKNTNRLSDYKLIKAIPDKLIPTTLFWIARMRSEGANIPESSKEYFDTRLVTAISDGQKMALAREPDHDGEPIKETSKPSQKPSVHDRSRAKMSELCSQVEEKLDAFVITWEPEFSMIDWLRGNEVSNSAAKYMHDFYNPQLLEVEVAATSNKAEDREGYEDLYKNGNLTKLYGFLVMIVEDLEQHMQNRKNVRKVRVKKPMSTEKKLKDFKYKNFDNTLKIQSVYPSKIIGAAELWVFNVKYNQLTVLRMEDAQVGLDVHRTAITKFDPKTSKTKKLRANQVDQLLKDVASAGKVALRTLIDNAKGSDQKLQERMNENTLLLRVIPR